MGHLKAVKNILGTVDELVVVVGSSQYSHTLDNPFTTGERVTMIKRTLEVEGIDMSRCWIIPVPDVHIHMLWVAQIVGYTPKFHMIYTNEPLTRRLFIDGGFEVKPVPFHKRKILSATEIRKRMVNGEKWRDLVPTPVSQLIEEIGGIERLRDLTKTDRI
jgi:nicotinamide-nucleotide adenylyltransferase